MWQWHRMPWGANRVEERWRESENCCCPEKKSGSLPPFIIASRAGKHTRGRGGLGGCGKEENSWRLVEVVKLVFWEKWQKVFVVDLGKKMNSSCHKSWQGQMAWENKWFHQDWVHFGKVANATFVNPRNQQKWTFQDLAMQIYSPWCTTWCSVIIWGS